MKLAEKGKMKQKGEPIAENEDFSLEREKLLSKILGDPTVAIFRDEEESYSTWRGLRVGTKFREFPQTP